MRRRIQRPGFAPALARVACGLALVGLGTLVLVAAGADLATAIPVLLLAVVVASTLGYVAGLAAALLGFATLNYYFTEPLHSFAIDRTDNLVALVVFVAIAALVGTGVARLNELRNRSARAEREAVLRLSFLHRLAAGADVAEVLAAAAEELVDLFDLARCSITADGRTYLATGDRAETGSLTLQPTPTFRIDVDEGRPLDAGERSTIEALGASLAATLELMRLDAEAREQRLRGELDRSRAGFLTAVTHDLRTPLATIKAGTYALLVGGPRLSDAERQRVLEVTHEESARLERLVTNVLELTRIRGGALRPAPVRVDAADLVRAAVKRLRRLTDGRDIELRLDPDLPPLWVDPALLEHVIVNLLENALRYSPPDRPIRIGAVQVGPRQQLRIVDHGPGVAVKDRTRMFDEFVRLDPTAVPSGTGLGLAIVRGFVESSGGTVAYEETPGGGATFVVDLPVARGGFGP